MEEGLHELRSSFGSTKNVHSLMRGISAVEVEVSAENELRGFGLTLTDTIVTGFTSIYRPPARHFVWIAGLEFLYHQWGTARLRCYCISRSPPPVVTLHCRDSFVHAETLNMMPSISYEWEIVGWDLRMCAGSPLVTPLVCVHC